MTGADDLDDGLKHLVACCRGDADDGWFAGQPSPEAFASVVSLALRHRVVPQLFRAWSARGLSSAVPPSARDRIEQLHFSGIARNVVLIEALKEILGLFGDAGIRAFPFKGPLLALQLHGDAGARMLSDLDFLVHEGDLRRARDVLCSGGWRDTRPMSAAAERVWDRAGRGCNLEHPDTDAIVNLRTAATPDYLPGEIGWNALWEKRGQTTFEGCTAPMPPADALPVLLCWHGAKHAWSRLVWIADLDALVRRGLVPDWASAARKAEEMGAGRLLGLGLLRANSVFGTPIPEELLDAARRDVPAACDAYCRLRLTTRQPEAYRWWREQLFYLRVWEGVAARGGQVLRIVFRPTITDYDAFNLPPGMEWLYGVLRPFRLAAKFAGKAIRARE